MWGDVARRFDLEGIQKHPPPVLVVFTSLRLTEFQERITPSTTNDTCVIIDPDIPQKQEYKKEFSKPGDKLKVIPNLSRQAIEEEAQKQTRKAVS
ncbi:putative nucleic acid-binding protein [Rosa chinensis]|uniref:Putative nucleic acid-binding protein n=1 Tax=Rosa chinensis TaxID=74649 RepID=A0A2P6QF92_ROSCH|nr:putative nucleic acid-binding protein [Rosa chinensis]